MAEDHEERKKAPNSLTLILIIIIFAAAIISAVLSLIYPGFVNLISGTAYNPGGAIYNAIYVVLTIAADVLYLFGGGVITFGAILVIIHFIQYKLRDPFKPTASTLFLSGYLTLSLNFFIGAEIIRTVVVGTSEIELLLLVIASRGLFTLILYLERRWRGTAEAE